MSQPDSATTAAAYRPLASPLPSHPGLSSTKSSNALRAPAVSAGALSAISALLGSNRAKATETSPRSGGRQRRSSLLARRMGEQASSFSLGQEATLQFPRARSAASTAQDDLNEIPPLERRARERSRNDIYEDDLPPSPVGLPGGWLDGQADLLPPPFLDHGSTAQSFEGSLLHASQLIIADFAYLYRSAGYSLRSRDQRAGAPRSSGLCTRPPSSSGIPSFPFSHRVQTRFGSWASRRSR